MAFRVINDDEVRAIIDLDDSITDLTSFIATANSLVTEKCLSSGYSAARLKLIELWLAAHFCAIRDLRSSSEGGDGVNQSFQFKIGLNLANTMYGQQAMLLDTAGSLSSLSKKASGVGAIGATWLGEEFD